jgi:hypothetical protein
MPRRGRDEDKVAGFAYKAIGFGVQGSGFGYKNGRVQGSGFRYKNSWV